MDGYYRSGKLIDHKANADIAAAVAERNGQKIDKVLVWRRFPRPKRHRNPDGRGPRLSTFARS